MLDEVIVFVWKLHEISVNDNIKKNCLGLLYLEGFSEKDQVCAIFQTQYRPEV